MRAAPAGPRSPTREAENEAAFELAATRSTATKVATGAASDTDKPAQAFLASYNITYPNGPDLESKIYRTFRARGVPETYVINQRGEIARTFIGPVKESELRASLDTLLGVNQ